MRSSRTGEGERGRGGGGGVRTRGAGGGVRARGIGGGVRGRGAGGSGARSKPSITSTDSYSSAKATYHDLCDDDE